LHRAGVEGGGTLITREEVVAGLFALHGILEEVREITFLLRDDDGEAEEPENES
jgi:hypothetical protein